MLHFVFSYFFSFLCFMFCVVFYVLCFVSFCPLRCVVLWFVFGIVLCIELCCGLYCVLLCFLCIVLFSFCVFCVISNFLFFVFFVLYVFFALLCVWFWNFLTFPNYQKLDFCKFWILIPPPSEGDSKKMKISKIGRWDLVLSVIFRAHKTKSKKIVSLKLSMLRQFP